MRECLLHTCRYSGDPNMRGRATGALSVGSASAKAWEASRSDRLYFGWTTCQRSDGAVYRQFDYWSFVWEETSQLPCVDFYMINLGLPVQMHACVPIPQASASLTGSWPDLTSLKFSGVKVTWLLRGLLSSGVVKGATSCNSDTAIKQGGRILQAKVCPSCGIERPQGRNSTVLTS